MRTRSYVTSRHAGIKHALELGRAQGAIQQIAGIKFDVNTSFEELGEVLKQAKTESQLSAAVNACISRAKLFRLIDSREAIPTAQTITFIFKRYNDQPEVINGIEGTKSDEEGQHNAT
jgi:hypothetical protein